jgi:O-antigen/teichoic acid export membrane protein
MTADTLASRARSLAESGFRRLAIRPETGTEALLFTGGNVLVQGARFLATLLVARLLGPTLYGLWNGLLLVLNNGVYYGHLGVLNGMDQEVPRNHGRGAEAENAPLVDSAFGVALLSASLVAVGCLAGSFLADDPANAFGLRLLALIVVAEQLRVFYDVLLRSHARFRAAALGQALLAVLMVTVVLGATWWAGFAGFLWAQAASFVAVAAVLARLAPGRPRPRLDWRRAAALARIGFPIMASSFAYGLLTSLDRVMVLAFLGRAELGYYSIGFMAYGTMMLVPRSVSQMLYPRMAREYGRTGDPRSLRPLVMRPIALLAGVMVPVLAAVFFLGPWFVERFLPEYVPGIPAFRIVLVGVFFLSFLGGFGNLLNVVGRQKLYLGIQLGALGLNFTLNAAFLAAGRGITGVATATLLSQAAFAGALAAVSARVLRKGPDPGKAYKPASPPGA